MISVSLEHSSLPARPENTSIGGRSGGIVRVGCLSVANGYCWKVISLLEIVVQLSSLSFTLCLVSWYWHACPPDDKLTN